MSEIIELDPVAVSSATREPLDITGWVTSDGVDWGDAQIAAAMNDGAVVGSTVIDYRIPNRTIKIPLSLRDDGTTPFSIQRAALQRKVGLFQREGGWLHRQVGSTSMYADIVNATLHLGGSWLQAYRDIDIDAELTLETLPEFYGDEVTLDVITATGSCEAVLKQDGSDALIDGDHPGRARIVLTDTSGHDQKSVLWGFRCRHYDPTGSAFLVAEAEVLTPVGGAAIQPVAGASGGQLVRLDDPPSDWISMLSTTGAPSFGSVPVTHTGSYRVWARCYSSSATPWFRLLWGVGALSVPVENDPVQLPGSAEFYMVDLGEIRLDPSPVGIVEWFGIIQTKAAIADPPAGDWAGVDVLYLQPLDEAAGRAEATVATIPPSGVNSQQAAQTLVNDASNGGTLAWDVHTTGATAFAASLLTTEYLVGTDFGFTVPAPATITGIQLTVARHVTSSSIRYAPIVNDNRVRLVKAGSVLTADKADHATPWPIAQSGTRNYGGATDLWGTTWTPADINDLAFGCAIAGRFARVSTTIGGFGGFAIIDGIEITVFYTIGVGFTIPYDAVLYANQHVELRWDGNYRADPAGAGVYAPVAKTLGDLARIPPSGIEGRPVQVFAKPSRGFMDQQIDSGIDPALDSFTVEVHYRPSYLYVSG